jgi:hypothetical protein
MSEPMRDFEQSTFEDILVTMIENAANRIHKNFKDIATFEEATATIRSTLGQLLEDCEELAAAMYILHECFTDVEWDYMEKLKEKEGKEEND